MARKPIDQRSDSSPDGRANDAAARLNFDSVIGESDDRTPVSDTRVSPYAMICQLRIKMPDLDEPMIGTGWMAGPDTVITAGHCLFRPRFGGLATTVTVVPAAQDGRAPFGEHPAVRFWPHDRWRANMERDYDIGCIKLPLPVGNGALPYGALGDAQIVGISANTAGFPLTVNNVDYPNGDRMFEHAAQIESATAHRLFHATDVTEGQSGAPIWIIRDGRPCVVGVHTKPVEADAQGPGASYNSGPRITVELAALIANWVQMSPPTVPIS